MTKRQKRNVQIKIVLGCLALGLIKMHPFLVLSIVVLAIIKYKP